MINGGTAYRILAQPKNGLKDYAEEAYYLLKNLSINNCIVIGISVGGMIAPILAYSSS
jgi:esterase/lipase